MPQAPCSEHMSNGRIPQSVDSDGFSRDNDYFYWNISDSCRSQFWEDNINTEKKLLHRVTRCGILPSISETMETGYV